MVTFLKRTLTVFLARVRPLSRQLKPRCMMNTRAAESIIQMLFAVKSASSKASSSARASPGASQLAASRAAPVRTVRVRGRRNIVLISNRGWRGRWIPSEVDPTRVPAARRVDLPVRLTDKAMDVPNAERAAGPVAGAPGRGRRERMGRNRHVCVRMRSRVREALHGSMSVAAQPLGSGARNQGPG
jgi:hypothetical protein